MAEFSVKILSIRPVTPDVKVYRVEKPSGYTYLPGQATETAVDRPGWTAETRPFTFTSLGADPWLEFTVKSYRDHDGVTKLLDTLVPGDGLLIHDVWGELTYRGPGLFVAGGAGITPFLAIFRDLKARGTLGNPRLLYGNKTPADIIEKGDLTALLGLGFQSFTDGRFLGAQDIKNALRPGDWVYLCGPDPMMEAVTKIVADLGLSDRLVVEP